jgi:Carboxypeptidase regulatory-like domain/TonB dependent receptor/TonB-dependent Receptor Plug Domain
MPFTWHHSFLRLIQNAPCILVVVTIFPFLQALATDTANIYGVVFTIETVNGQHVREVWPNARIALRGRLETSTVSSDRGAYTFTEVPAGEYDLSVTLKGFEPALKHVVLNKNEKAHVDFQLVLATHRQSINVTADETRVDLETTSDASPVLTATVLRNVIQLNQDFQNALPLLPGVIRGLDGELHIKGGRANQTSTLVNTASIADPFTGQPALRLPAVAVQSVQVLSNPFSAEYGKFASGVVEVNTRGGTDKWKVLFEDPIPRFRWVNGHTHGVESASPHLTFSGPLAPGKLYIFESLLYGYDTVRVPSLPDPYNVRVQETATSYTQLDWNPTATQRFTAVLTADPQETKFANINTFNPQPVTADYRQRSFFTSLVHRWIFADGGFLQSLFSAKRFDSRVYPADSDSSEMLLFPERNSGSFYQEQRYRTRLYQWSEALHARPLQGGGKHLLTIGGAWVRSTYEGDVQDHTVRVLREDSTLSQLIEYGHGIQSARSKDETSAFVQDKWQINSRLTLDLGMRLDHDSLSVESVNVAPRMGFVFAPTRDNRTAIRGGFGVFFDKIPINVAVFQEYPAQTITIFRNDGLTIANGPTTAQHVIATSRGRLRVPYSLGWTLQVDRELTPSLLLRLGYQERQGYRDFFVDPVPNQLQLRDSGRQSYREFLGMLRIRRTERLMLYLSYVRSSAKGELNDYNQFFGSFPTPLIRPNQYGPLSSDAPDRGLIWGVIPLPKKFDFVPVLDVHTGFPFSRWDQDWNYAGQANRAGRFPTFIGLDTKFYYPVDFTFRKHRIQFRLGLSLLNVLNRFNPRDVQQYGPSPNFGQFYNSVGRQFRLDGEFGF